MELNEPGRQMTFTKNVALVTAYGTQELSLRKQKALHAITLTVREHFFLRNPNVDSTNIHHLTEEDVQNTNTTFNIEEERVMEAMGYTDKKKYYSYGQVLKIFNQIADETLGFDGLGIVRSHAEREKWTGFTKILGSVERIDGYFRFNMPPKLVHRIINPEVSFRGPVSWSGYKTKHTLGIYESCLYFWQSGKPVSDWFEIEYLRRITSSSGKTFDDYNKFRTRVLDKTLTNINEAPELDLHISFEEASLGQEKKVGRKKVTHIRFNISEKVGLLADTLDVRDGITLSVVSTELESLGIARNLVCNVIDECKDDDGKLCMGYLKWAIRKGHELRKLTKFKPQLAVSSEEKKHNFGGYFRKHVIRGRKQEWMTINNTLWDLVDQTGQSTSKLRHDEFEDRVGHSKKVIKTQIAVAYIEGLSENAFTHLKDEFIRFLENQLPLEYARYNEGKYGQSITEMALNGEFCMFLYFDYCLKIFTPDAFKCCISQSNSLSAA